MEAFEFVDSKSLSEETLRKLVALDNEIPTEFDSAWRPTDFDRVERLKYYRELPESDFLKSYFWMARSSDFTSFGKGEAS